MSWADRNRDKLRLTADWFPAESWSVRFIADVSRDDYSGRALGPRSGSVHFFSTDTTWHTNDWTCQNWVNNGASGVAAAARNSDGTTVRYEPRENVVDLGITYHLRWRRAGPVPLLTDRSISSAAAAWP